MDAPASTTALAEDDNINNDNNNPMAVVLGGGEFHPPEPPPQPAQETGGENGDEEMVVTMTQREANASSLVSSLSSSFPAPALLSSSSSSRSRVDRHDEADDTPQTLEAPPAAEGGVKTSATSRASDERSMVSHATSSSSKRLHSSHSSGMDSSVLRFKNLCFTVLNRKNKKQPISILSDVSGRVKWGHVLAIMGPSGAGKSTLIKTLTLDALYGKATGTVTLNGVPMNDAIFKNHCFVVEQFDWHWPFLTCRETLHYGAELYEVAAPEDIDSIVDEIVDKMGLRVCVDTRNNRLSGGQRRRLSIAIALLKQPTLLFLDEPTTSLDAASASNIMEEIIRVAKDERLIIVCTIHQPSTKVYNSFDQLMLMSRGRLAYNGDVKDSLAYFASIGYPCPPNINPAEFFLDLVNSDFSDEDAVTKILDTWEEKQPEAGSSVHKQGFGKDDGDEQQGVADIKRAPLRIEIAIMFRRHFTLIVRDPLLYVGRCFIFLLSNSAFALIYLTARGNDQDQAANKAWTTLWFVAIPSNMGVVAVFALNSEFKSVLRECRNGMIRGSSYVFAKSILVLPVFFVFALFALGIPSFVIQGVPGGAFLPCIVLFACMVFVFESVAECMSVWFDDPIIGMLMYVMFWFASFLFGGIFIAPEYLYWPIKVFFYIMPFGYYIPSTVYQVFVVQTFESCSSPAEALTSVCTPSTSGLDVLDQLAKVFPIYTTEDQTNRNIVCMVVIGLFYKALYIIGVLYKTSKVVKITEA